jgi:hypothetical protein
MPYPAEALVAISILVIPQSRTKAQSTKAPVAVAALNDVHDAA